VNTKDFIPFKYNKGEAFNFIFEKQKGIFISFMKLEGINIPDYNFDINCYEDQQLIKDFLQIRFIEELTEATLDINNKDHFVEEMIDAFNFLIESYILYGYDYEDLRNWKKINHKDVDLNRCPITYIHSSFYRVVESVGKTCNLLKNRPWRSSHYLTDLYLFEKNLKDIWIKFNELCNMIDLNEKELFEVWSLKYQVNIFRLKTGY
jgi:hypothetical protein